MNINLAKETPQVQCFEGAHFIMAYARCFRLQGRTQPQANTRKHKNSEEDDTLTDLKKVLRFINDFIEMLENKPQR